MTEPIKKIDYTVTADGEYARNFAFMCDKINALIEAVEVLEKRVEELEYCNCLIKRPDGITKVCHTCNRKVKII